MENKNVCLHLNEEENSQLKFIMHEIYHSLKSIDMALGFVNDRNLSTPKGHALIKEMVQKALEASFDINSQLDFWQMSNDAHYFDKMPMHYQYLWERFSRPSVYFVNRLKKANIEYVVEKVGTEIIRAYYGYGIINALSNIMLDNALKYTKKGGLIECRFEYNNDNALMITMENSGPYVPADEIPGLFSCGVRGCNAIEAGYRGSGYGLNFLKTIVDAHDGKINIESEYTHQVDGIKFGQFRICVILPDLSENDYDDD